MSKNVLQQTSDNDVMKKSSLWSKWSQAGQYQHRLLSCDDQQIFYEIVEQRNSTLQGMSANFELHQRISKSLSAGEIKSGRFGMKSNLVDLG